MKVLSTVCLVIMKRLYDLGNMEEVTKRINERFPKIINPKVTVVTTAWGFPVKSKTHLKFGCRGSYLPTPWLTYRLSMLPDEPREPDFLLPFQACLFGFSHLSNTCRIVECFRSRGFGNIFKLFCFLFGLCVSWRLKSRNLRRLERKNMHLSGQLFIYIYMDRWGDG